MCFKEDVVEENKWEMYDFFFFFKNNKNSNVKIKVLFVAHQKNCNSA